MPGGCGWVGVGGGKRSHGCLLPCSLAGLVDVLVDVLSGGQLGDTRLGLLVSDLGGCRGEVLIALNTTHTK